MAVTVPGLIVTKVSVPLGGPSLPDQLSPLDHELLPPAPVHVNVLGARTAVGLVASATAATSAIPLAPAISRAERMTRG
jgi:hypothetical protein